MVNKTGGSDRLPEHRSRLRGGWESRTVDSPDDRQRVTLPIHWDPERAGRMRLYRKFGCPVLQASQQTLVLELEQVPGICSISPNDRLIAGVPSAESRLSLELVGLPDRNVLVLEIDLKVARSRSVATGAPWGRLPGHSRGRLRSSLLISIVTRLTEGSGPRELVYWRASGIRLR